MARSSVRCVGSVFGSLVLACCGGGDPGGSGDAIAGDVPLLTGDSSAGGDTTSEDTAPSPETIVFDTGSGVDGGGDETDTAARTCDDTPRPFFCPCDINAQCESSYCIAVDEDDVARRCSRTCQDSCPNGWECKGVGGAGDPVFICQPPIDTLCDPCEQHADCQAVGARCVELADGKYCGRDCGDPGATCPPGYGCEELLNADGQIEAYQCVRTSGSCNCPDGTDYTSDPANCAVCGHACEFPHGIGGCAQSICHLAGCESDWKDLDREDANGCEYRCTARAGEDWPDATCNAENDCDQNCDGIDGDIARAIFVAPFGASDASGAPTDPVDTIARALALAAPGAKDHVYVAAGTYNESVTMVEGVSIFGGYSNDGRWARNLSQYKTTISWSAGTNSVRTVIAQNIANARTVLGGVEVVSGTNANPSGSSYAIWVRDAGAALEITDVIAVGGNGGAGAAGGPGSPGGSGDIGTKGTSSSEHSGGASGTCTDCGCDEESSYGGPGGGGAPNTCATGADSGGGKGGNGRCGDGNDGQKGGDSPGGAAGGPAANGDGNRGTSGGPGASGGDGAGGTAAGDVSGSGLWIGVDGGSGLTGGNGVGGGGGSGGGGNDNGGFDCASWGGGGGGGGSGGCGGGGAGGGKAGGGSFGLFLFDASPTIVRSQLGHKNGGNGGTGGTGGGGGTGKDGGGGGSGCFEAGDGGAGGRGGDGGRGGHGGGGAGGVAYGLYLAGGSDPSCQGLSFSPAGAGGAGGIGGQGPGNRGADGAFGDRNRASPSCP